MTMNVLKATTWSYAAVCYNAMDRMIRESEAPIAHLLSDEAPDHRDYVKLVGQLMDYAKDLPFDSPTDMPQPMMDAFTLESIAQCLTLGPYQLDEFNRALQSILRSMPGSQRDRGRVVCIAVLTLAGRFADNPLALLQALGVAPEDIPSMGGVRVLEGDSLEEVMDQLRALMEGGAPEGTTLQ